MGLVTLAGRVGVRIREGIVCLPCVTAPVLQRKHVTPGDGKPTKFSFKTLVSSSVKWE